MYRPPKQKAVDDAALYEEILDITQNKQLVIIGDFKVVKLGAYAEAARGLGAHLRDIGL